MKCHLWFQLSAFCEKPLPSHQIQKILQCIKFYPCHLISSGLKHYHRIFSYCSLDIMETYFTGFSWEFPPGALALQRPWSCPALGKFERCNTCVSVLLRPLQNSQMDLLWPERGIIWLSQTIVMKASWEILPESFEKTEASAIYHTHTKRTSLHDFTIKEKTSKHIVTFKLKTMAWIKKHLFQVNYRCELLIETMTIIIGGFVLAHFVLLKT